MFDQPHEKLNEKLVCSHLCDVTKKGTAWILLQEPGFIGFGAVYKDKICWPPYIEQLDWARIRDIRLFGEKGEWHVWPHWNGGWQSRLLKLDNLQEHLTEYHVLWGTEVKCKDFPWIKLSEKRGAEIWLPLQGQVKDSKNNSDLPLRLKLKQVVDYDPEYHLAGIVDAALVGLVRSFGEELLLPTDLPPCS